MDTGERLKLGGDYIRELSIARGGETAHACMPGCIIECSNVYADADGKEIVSPVEYETIGLMGTNCGLADPDDLARANAAANDLGIDSIEAAPPSACSWRRGSESSATSASCSGCSTRSVAAPRRGASTRRAPRGAGAHFGVKRVPVIKKQAISAYDPRVIEATGITMMVTAQGADHTAGNVPRMNTEDKSTDEVVDASMEAQVAMAAADSLGFCIFGRGVTNTHLDMIATAINNAVGTRLDAGFFHALGRETLKLEAQFNRQAGFTVEDDELPAFFYDEALPPSDRTARFHGEEVRASVARWWAQSA